MKGNIILEKTFLFGLRVVKLFLHLRKKQSRKRTVHSAIKKWHFYRCKCGGSDWRIIKKISHINLRLHIRKEEKRDIG